jgi:crossover junction endodeoxyribonuclease RuvC
VTVIRRILGIDPGSRLMGFGIIEKKHGCEPICLTGGCLRLLDKSLPVRLGVLFSHVKELVEAYQPTELAIEQVFVHKNAQSALKLGQARGAAIAAVMSANLPVYEYAARQIKQAVVGRGGADKAQIQHMIQILLKLQIRPQADAADALAVALCHLHTISSPIVEEGALSLRRRSRKRTTRWKRYDRTTTR